MSNALIKDVWVKKNGSQSTNWSAIMSLEDIRPFQIMGYFSLEMQGELGSAMSPVV